MAYLMVIDLGTSSLKTIIIDEVGNVKAQSARPYQFSSPAAVMRSMIRRNGGRPAVLL